MNESYIRNVIEASLLAAGRPLQLAEIAQLFDENARPAAAELRAALDELATSYEGRGIEVKETAAGFRIQVRKEMANEVSRLWPERPQRYSRALLETLALIAYRQPITRAEIEAVRGVAVNPNIIKTVVERNWVRAVGHRDVPGRPELLATTKEFLDYFGLRTLEELPPLAELKAMGDINMQLQLADGATLTEAGAAGEGEIVPGNEDLVPLPAEPLAQGDLLTDVVAAGDVVADAGETAPITYEAEFNAADDVDAVVALANAAGVDSSELLQNDGSAASFADDPDAVSVDTDPQVSEYATEAGELKPLDFDGDDVVSSVLDEPADSEPVAEASEEDLADLAAEESADRIAAALVEPTGEGADEARDTTEDELTIELSEESIANEPADEFVDELVTSTRENEG